MAISFIHVLHAFLLLLYPLCCFQKSLHSHHDVKVSSLLASNVCNQTSKVDHDRGSSLEVVHKYGPCAQLMNHEYKPENTNSPSHQVEMLIQDQLRVDSIHARFPRKSSGFKEAQTTLPVQSGISLGTGNYLVTIALGTPKKDVTVVFDTGSDITWTQCEPCVGSCYKQSQPKFDPRSSSSYKNVSCSSSSCDLIRDSDGARGCSSSVCLYQVQYADGTYSIGFFATEKLTIKSSDVFTNFLFGCGQQNNGRLGLAAGILGLGRSQLSLALQTANKYKKIFSYCIPSSSSSTGHLNFGAKIPKATKFTPISPAFKSTPFYGIDITGISVGGRKLSVNASVYTEGGAIIDSGTVITRLQPTVYSALSSTFRKMMKDYTMTDGVSIFDTCYDFSGHDTVRVPVVKIFFGGGIEVDVSGTLVALRGVKQVCLAFAPNDDDGDVAIFGNTQQQGYEVVHDLAKGRVGFAAGGCS